MAMSWRSFGSAQLALVHRVRAAHASNHQRDSLRAFCVRASQLVRIQDTGLEISPLPHLQVNSVPVVYSPQYSAPSLRPGHRFPMQIFRHIHDYLLLENIVSQKQVLQPYMPTREMLHLTHDEAYIHDFLNGTLSEAIKRRIGFQEDICMPVLINRTLSEVAGVLMTAELALQYGLACNTAGGTHHAHRDAGSGFCIINDLAITAEVLLKRRLVNRVLILDLDVHQGDGTATIFQGRSDVYTCSFHAANNFPTRKQRSTLDISFSDGTGDDVYCGKLAEVLPDIIGTFKPDLCLYDAGVDSHVEDELGRLRLSNDGLFRRDMLVFETCLMHGVPIAGNVGGGYCKDLWKLASWHAMMHRAATECWSSFKL